MKIEITQLTRDRLYHLVHHYQKIDKDENFGRLRTTTPLIDETEENSIFKIYGQHLFNHNYSLFIYGDVCEIRGLHPIFEPLAEILDIPSDLHSYCSIVNNHIKLKFDREYNIHDSVLNRSQLQFLVSQYYIQSEATKQLHKTLKWGGTVRSTGHPLRVIFNDED